ncbi:hypothetical protein [Chitinimonas sp. JJ19]|uniref:hypothetical protein n=1 Tax=Chitinimonas sp. JJ19 TaxID=3109352 RepID=UPI0030032DB1
MRICKIDNEVIDCSLVGVDAHGFGRPLAGEYAIPYSLRISVEEVATYFGGYYQEFVDRESEDEGYLEELEGWALLIKETGYLSLEKMLVEQTELISKLLLNELPAEFMGYMFLDEIPALSKKYILQTLVALEVTGGAVLCTGMAFINPEFPR